MGAQPDHCLGQIQTGGCGLSKGRSTWRNRPDGKTVRRNTVAAQFSSRPVELLRSPAYRVLSRSAHQALSRIEIELRQHGGNANGKLIVTTQQFIEYGIERRMVPAALRELDALGIIRITVRGRGGNAEHRQPNRFLLNYLCGAVDAHDLVTDAWNEIEVVEEAQEILRAARAAKDRNKVAYSRRHAQKRKHFSGTLNVAGPGTLNVPENAKSPGTLSVPTGPGTLNVPTIEISGGGGGRGGRFPKNPSAAMPQAEPSGLPMWSAPVLTELEWNGDWQRHYGEVTGQTRPASMLVDDKLDIPKFLLRGHPDCAFT